MLLLNYKPVIFILQFRPKSIEIKNNKARHNLMNVKYRQIAFRSVDGAVVGSFLVALSQAKVMQGRQIEMP